MAQSAETQALAAAIRKRMRRAGWSPRQLAEKAGLSHHAVLNFLNGRVDPRPETQTAIAAAVHKAPPHPALAELLREAETEPPAVAQAS